LRDIFIHGRGHPTMLRYFGIPPCRYRRAAIIAQIASITQKDQQTPK
jgi:hypothetical protein